MRWNSSVAIDPLFFVFMIFVTPLAKGTDVYDSDTRALTGHEKGLVVLVDYADTTDADREGNFTYEQILQLMVTNEDSVENYMQESSRGQYSIKFDVLDYQTLKHPAAYYAGLNRDALGPAAENEALQELSEHIDLQHYDRIILLLQDLPGPYGPHCAATTFSVERLDRQFPVAMLPLANPGCITKTALNHELGHTMGFHHSMALNCKAIPGSVFDTGELNASCFEWTSVNHDLGIRKSVNFLYRAADTVPGGIAYDIMDGRLNSDEQANHLFNAIWQNSAGWLNADEVLAIEQGDDTTFTLTMLEAPHSVDGIRLLTVDLGVGSDRYPYQYHLEYRDHAACEPVLHLQGPRFGWQNYPSQERPGTTYIITRNYREPSFADTRTLHDRHRGIRFEVIDCDENHAESLQMEVSFSGLSLTPELISHSTGEIQSVAVSNNNTEAVQIGSIHLGGRNPWAFDIISDGCSGETLEAGRQCLIEYQYRPSSDEDVAVLTIPNDDELRPEATITLHGENTRGLPLEDSRFSETKTALYYPASHIKSPEWGDEFAGLLLMTVQFDNDEGNYYEALFELDDTEDTVTFDYIGHIQLGSASNANINYFSPFIHKVFDDDDWTPTYTFKDTHNIGTYITALDEVVLPIVELVGPGRAFMENVRLRVDPQTLQLTLDENADTSAGP